MELSKYIELIKTNTQAKEVNLEVRLNEKCYVDDNGSHKVKLKLTRLG